MNGGGVKCIASIGKAKTQQKTLQKKQKKKAEYSTIKRHRKTQEYSEIRATNNKKGLYFSE